MISVSLAAAVTAAAAAVTAAAVLSCPVYRTKLALLPYSRLGVTARLDTRLTHTWANCHRLAFV